MTGKVDSAFIVESKSLEVVVQSVTRARKAASEGEDLPSSNGTTLSRNIDSFALSAPRLSNFVNKAGYAGIFADVIGFVGMDSIAGRYSFRCGC